MTTDITELAQSEINDALAQLKQISEYPTPSTQYARVLRRYFASLVEELELKEEQRANWFQMAQKLGEDLDAAEKRNAELESSVIATGILRCTECSFVEAKSIISVTAGTITTGNSEPEPCPNGCGQLQPVTWKALAIQLMFTTKQGLSDLLEAKKRIAELDAELEREREKTRRMMSRIAELESRTVTVKQGEVLVTVAGFTGCGKSAIAGEIEIAMKAIGLPVTWANGDSEKRMTGADWLTAIEMYKPTVRIVEVNIPRAAGIKVEAE